MPTYSYECKRCHNVHEVFHSMNANPRVKCPECGGPCKRLLGIGAGIIFKGSGFYETDYKRKSGKAPGKPVTKETTEKKKETKGEAKHDTKDTSKSPSTSTD